MKTLKKSLCLVLALVMVLSMGVISASADLKYEDVEDITYAEAVDVMSGIGVLEGYPDDTFLPTKEVTRAEAAKIITYMMVGDSAYAANLEIDEKDAHYTDVPADHWAAGYIYYLDAAKIVSGCGDGTYQPDAPVTGLAFAKMLMGAVGYGVKGEFVGENWAIKTAKAALQYGIFEENLAGANNEAATREECALYAFNAMFLDKVSYSELFGDYIKDSVLDNAQSNKEDTIANDLGGVKKVDVIDLDAFERVVEYGYKYVNAKSKAISGVYGDPSDVTLLTSTTAVTGNELYKVLGKDQLDYIVVDGEVMPTYMWNTDKGNLDQLLFTGNGVEVKVFQAKLPTPVTNKDGEEIIVMKEYTWATVVNQYLGQITKVTKETDTRYAKTRLTIDLGRVCYTEVLEDYGFEKGDYVFVTMTKDGEIQSVEAADSFVGTITKYSNKGNYLTVNGEKYEVAEKTADAPVLDLVYGVDFLNECNVGDKRTFYVDKYGYIVAVSDIIAEPTDYVYVAKYGYERVDASDRLSGDTYNLTCVYYDSNAEEHVAVVDMNKLQKKYEITCLKEMIDVVTTLNNNAKDANTDGIGLYAAEVKNGKIALTEPDYTFKKAWEVQQGLVRFADGEAKHYADEDTIFFYVKGEYGKPSWDLKVYTGIDNVPVNDESIEYATVKQGFHSEEEKDGNTKVYTYAAASVRWDSAEETSIDKTIYMYTGEYSYELVDGEYVVTYYVWLDGEVTTVTYTYDESTTDVFDTIKFTNAAAAGYFATFNDGVFNVNKDGYKPAANKYYYDQYAILENAENYVKFEVENNTLFVANKQFNAKNAEICVVRTDGSARFDYADLSDLMTLVAELGDVYVAVQYNKYDAASYIYIYEVVPYSYN